MPTFDTPEPIALELELAAGDVRISASDRTDTAVEVRPSDPDREADVRIAEQTRVEFANGRLLVRGPKQRTVGLLSYRRIGAIDVTVDLPTGSRVDCDGQVVTYRCTGQLGESRFRSATGDVQIERTGPLDLKTSYGAVEIDQIVGHADAMTGSGPLRIGGIEGSAVAKNANGDCWIGSVSGDLRVNTSNGDITVERAAGDVTASTANGDVRIAEVVRGSAVLKTAAGEVEVGIRAGTAARLDMHTSFGRVHNHLDSVDRPEPTDETADIRARTGYGDIIIRRA